MPAKKRSSGSLNENCAKKLTKKALDLGFESFAVLQEIIAYGCQETV